MPIKIGNIKPLRTENWQIIPDDRQTRIETIGGIAIQDMGHFIEGYIFSCSITVPADDARVILDNWRFRTLVTIKDPAGEEYTKRRVVVKKYSYVERFEGYYNMDIEFWGDP